MENVFQNSRGPNDTMVSSISSADIKLTPITGIKVLDANNSRIQSSRITETLKKASSGITFSPERMNDNYDYLNNLPFSQQIEQGDENNSILLQSTPGGSKDKNSAVVRNAYNLFNKRHSFSAGNNRSFTRSSPIRAYGASNRKRKSKKKDNLRKLASDEPKSPLSSNLDTSVAALSVVAAADTTVKIKNTNLLHIAKEFFSDPQCIKNLTTVIQIIMNVVLFGLVIMILVMSLNSIKKDADVKIQSYINESNSKVNQCKREYIRNNCDPALRVPALEQKCSEWESCMLIDPNEIVSSIAYFEILADCINAFFHNLSIRSMIGIISTTLSIFIIPNIVLNKFKNTNTTTTTTTTTTNNYYLPKTGSKNSESLTAAGVIDQSVYFTPSSPHKTPLLQLTKDASSGSVRFNPNVSYSFYDVEGGNNDDDDEEDDDDELVVRNGNFNVVGNLTSTGNGIVDGWGMVANGSPLGGKFTRNRDKY